MNIKGKYHFSKSSKARLNGVHPYLIATTELALKLTMIDFGIPKMGGVRTDKEQYNLYLDQLSRCDGIEQISKHQKQVDGYSHALDFYAYVNGKASWKKSHLAAVAQAHKAAFSILQTFGDIPEEVELVWGGTFGSKSFDGWDFPHLELKFK